MGIFEETAEVIGSNCTSFFDCGLYNLACSSGTCVCLMENGYYGNTCSEPSVITQFGRIICVIFIIAIMSLLLVAFGMLRAYVIPKVYPNAGKMETYFTSSLHSKTNVKNRMPLKKRKSALNARDKSIIMVMMYNIPIIMNNLGHLATLTFDPSNFYDNNIKYYVFPFQFLVLNLSQNLIGLAWAETAVKTKNLRFLKTHLRKIKGFVNFVSAIETIVATAMTVKKVDKEKVAAVYVSLLILGTIVLVFGAWFLSREMLMIGASSKIVQEAQAIRKSALRFALMLVIFIISLSVMVISMGQNAWLYWFGKILAIIFTVGYQLSVFLYLDCKRKVFKSKIFKKTNKMIKVSGQNSQEHV